MKRILLYGLDEADADKTQIILDNLGIAAYIIGDDVLDEELGKVFDAQEDFDGRHQEFSTRFMLFDGMKAEELLPVLHTLAVEDQNFDGVKIMLMTFAAMMSPFWRVKVFFFSVVVSGIQVTSSLLCLVPVN